MSSEDQPRPRPRPGPEPDAEPEPVVIRDKRRIDPATGKARPAPGPAPAPDTAEPPSGALAEVEAKLAERTADLQRVQAEYANYRKRADRDRMAAGDLAVGRVLTEMLPVLDDIDRARAHGDLTGALKAVSEHLDAIFNKLGLVSFGEVGDPFDPTVHEAVTHDVSDEVDQPTCTMVMRPGYKHGDRLLRPAMVGVTDPAGPPAAGEPAEADAPAEPGEAGSTEEE